MIDAKLKHGVFSVAINQNKIINQRILLGCLTLNFTRANTLVRTRP